MKRENIKIKTDNYQEAVEKLGLQLKETKASRKECNNAMLLLEELFVSMKQQCGEDLSLDAGISRRFGEVALILAAKGEEYNPLEQENIWQEEEEDYYRSLIIRANKEKLSYSYKGGRNVIRIEVHSGSAKNVYYSLGAMAAGIIFGLIMKAFLPERVVEIINVNLFGVVKTLFLNSLKMMVAPVVFFSIACSISNLTDLSDLGKMGGKMIGLYMMTTVIAIGAGLGIGRLLSAGDLSFQGVETTSALAGQTFQVSIREIIEGIAPSNLVNPIIEGNMLQIIFVSVLFGVAANILGKEIGQINTIMGQMNLLCLKIVVLLVRFIPAAAFCSMASMILKTGAQSLLVVVRILAGVLLGGGLMLFVYMVMIAVLGKVSPFPFLKKALGFAITPFSLDSSNAAMPFTMDFCTKKLGISEKVSSFAVPLGATLNMDGHCVYLAVCALILMKLYGMPVTSGALATIVISIFVLSVGAPGVPGSGMICLSTITVTLGLPVECIGIVIGIDQIAGMLRTAFNVIGDTAVSVVIASSHGLLNKETYFKSEG